MKSTADIQAYLDISDLLARYAMSIDDQDWELLRSCFLADASLDYPNTDSMTRYEEFERLCRESMSRCSASQHLVGSIRIVCDGDSATSRSYAQASHQMLDGSLRITGTSYSDTLRRTPDGWRIASRRMARLWGEGPRSTTSGSTST